MSPTFPGTGCSCSGCAMFYPVVQVQRPWRAHGQPAFGPDPDQGVDSRPAPLPSRPAVDSSGTSWGLAAGSGRRTAGSRAACRSALCQPARSGVRPREVPVPVPPTAAVADAAVRLGVPVAVAPPSLLPVLPSAPFAGPAVPVTHVGSVDVFLEAIDDAPAGAVLVVDNGGRQDEACVGDLVVLEAASAGLVALVVWGRHRDTAELRRIGLPVHSLGAHPFGPRRVPPAGPAMRVAFLDGVPVTDEHVVVGDDDGVLVLPRGQQERLFALALEIQQTEARQAQRMADGESLRDQLDYAAYRRKQAADPSMTLRRYLAEHGGAIET